MLIVVIAVAGLLIFHYAYNRWIGLPAIVGAAWVIDGDTIDMASVRIRLEGIDAPESDQTCTDSKGDAWLCGRIAARELRAHIRGLDLRCARSGFDRFKRALAVCTLPDGSDVNAWMVRQGWALAFGFVKTYQHEEAEAQAAKRGIWMGSFVPPSQWRQHHPR